MRAIRRPREGWAPVQGHGNVHVGFFTLLPRAIIMKCQSVAEGLVL